MNPFTLFMLAIISPVLLFITLLVPPYAGIVAANYIIYAKDGNKVHPLADKLDHVFYMIDVYSKLFSHWIHHITESSLLTYALPLLLPVIFGIMLALWLTGRLSAKLKDIFQSNSSV